MLRTTARNILFFTMADRENIESFELLAAKVNKSIAEDKIDTALVSAHVAAVHYGAAGLILYLKTMLLSLRKELKEVSSVPSEAVECLGKLLACQEIMLKHPEELAKAKQAFPEDQFENLEYWQEMSKPFCEMAKVKQDEKSVQAHKAKILTNYILPEENVKKLI